MGPADPSGVGGIISRCDNAAIDDCRWKESDPSGGAPVHPVGYGEMTYHN